MDSALSVCASPHCAVSTRLEQRSSPALNYDLYSLNIPLLSLTALQISLRLSLPIQIHCPYYHARAQSVIQHPLLFVPNWIVKAVTPHNAITTGPRKHNIVAVTLITRLRKQSLCFCCYCCTRFLPPY